MKAKEAPWLSATTIRRKSKHATDKHYLKARCSHKRVVMSHAIKKSDQ